MSLHHKWTEYELFTLKLLGYSTILVTHMLQEADIKSEMKGWLPAWHASSAVLLGKDLRNNKTSLSKLIQMSFDRGS